MSVQLILSLIAARRQHSLPARLPRLPATTAPDAGPALQGWLPWAIALALLLLLASVLVVLVVTRKRRRRRRRALGPRFPIVLAHGLMGFDEIGLGPLRRHYFRGVPMRLNSMGCEVHRPRVARAGSVAERASELAEHVRRIAAPRVTIIAHSMGGLDARYAISRLGIAKKVAALITVGTPHHGTPVADFGATLLGGRLGLERAFAAVGVGVDAFYDLTSLRMEAFNREVEDHRSVEYGCVVGAAPDKLHVNPVLLPTYLFLLERAGANDGLVPAASQRWGEVLAEIEADHWAQIGWGRGFDARGFYESLARELRGRGF